MVPPVFWNIQNIASLQYTFPATLTNIFTQLFENGTIVAIVPQNQTVTAYRKGGALEMDENIESGLEKIKYTFWNLLFDEENFLARHNEGELQNLLGRSEVC